MKSSGIRAVKYANGNIVKIISGGGAVLWESMINVVVVGDYKGLPVDKIKEIVESNNEYRIVGAVDYSAFDGNFRAARRDLTSKIPVPNYPNRITIVLTANRVWVQSVYAGSRNRLNTPYHLLESEILSGLSMTAQTNLYGLIQSTGVDMAEFKAAADYMKSLREK